MMRRILMAGALALITQSAFAGVVVVGADAGLRTVNTNYTDNATSSVYAGPNGFHSILFKITGFDGIDSTYVPAVGDPKNAVTGIQGTFTVTGGTMFWSDFLDDGNVSNTGDHGGIDSAATNSRRIGTTTATAINLNGPAAFRSFVNLESAPDNTFSELPSFSETPTSVSGTWFTQGNNNSPPTASTTRLTPNDEGFPNFDQTLLARIFVKDNPGQTATVSFLGTYTSDATSLIGGGVPGALSFSFPASVVTNTPASITVTPGTGASMTSGSQVEVKNAAAAPATTRDTATISNLNVTSAQPLIGSFSQSGLTNNSTVSPGASQVGTVLFTKNPNSLNGAKTTGSMAFTVAGTSVAGSSGGGNFNYALTGEVQGNFGNGSAPVAGGGSYADLSSTSVQTRQGTAAGQLLGTTATILAGTNTTGAEVTVKMEWSARNNNEIALGARFGGGSTSPPMPSFAAQLTGDKVNITGIPDGQPFVLQMTYDPALFQGDDHSTQAAILAHEAKVAKSGVVQLVTFNEQTGFWENAILTNHNNTATDAQHNIQGSWASSGVGLTVGAWGIDISQHVLWAVIDHNSLFSSVPEPSSLALAGMSLLGLVAGYARRRKS